MTWHPRQLGQLNGRTLVVTGANCGIGLEAARELVGRPRQQGRHLGPAPVGPARFAQFRGPPELLNVYEEPATAARLWELTGQALGKPLPV